MGAWPKNYWNCHKKTVITVMETVGTFAVTVEAVRTVKSKVFTVTATVSTVFAMPAVVLYTTQLAVVCKTFA